MEYIKNRAWGKLTLIKEALKQSGCGSYVTIKKVKRPCKEDLQRTINLFCLHIEGGLVLYFDENANHTSDFHDWQILDTRTDGSLMMQVVY